MLLIKAKRGGGGEQEANWQVKRSNWGVELATF